MIGTSALGTPPQTVVASHQRYQRQAAVKCMVCRHKALSMKPILCLIATWPFQCGLLKRALSCRHMLAVRMVEIRAGAISWQNTSGKKCFWLLVTEGSVHHEI